MAMLKKMKQWLVLLLTFPAAAFATDNPLMSWAFKKISQDKTLSRGLKGLLQSEYMPLILGPWV